MVAKSYQDLEIASEPYSLNNRMYVKVRTANGNLKQVRWYTEAEYAKMYGEKEPKLPGSQRLALGFDKGYITIFKGETYPYKDWLKEHGARYAKFWGWYIISTMDVPAEMPSGVEAVKLPWELVGNGEDLLPEAQVTEAVNSLIYDDSPSQFQGTIGTTIERNITVDRIIITESYFGINHMYIMSDADSNVYVWSTTANRDWQEGDNLTVRANVKEWNTYRNVKQTILQRVREVS